MTHPGKQNIRLLFAICSAVVLVAGGCVRSEPPSTFQSSNTRGGREAIEIDRTKPLCPQMEAAAKAAIDSLLAEHDVTDREWEFDFLPRVDCWSTNDGISTADRLGNAYLWIHYPRGSARGVAVLGLLSLGSGEWPGFNMPDLVREWRDELIRRGFSPRAEKWDLKLVVVGSDGPTRFGRTEVCAIYSHGSDMVDYTDLSHGMSSQTRLRHAIRWAGELCQEPTPEEREKRRKDILEYSKWLKEGDGLTNRMCREGKLPPDKCKHLSD